MPTRALLHPRILALLVALGVPASCCAVYDGPIMESSADLTLPAALPVQNFLLLSERTVGGGPPSAETIAEMTSLGYSTIINLRSSGEAGVAEEAELAAAAGLHYVHLPITSSTTNLRNALALSQALENAPEGKVLLHCGSGNRVGAMWGLKEAIENGLDADTASEVARRSGMRSDRLEAGVRASIATAQAARD